jgi:hypothetical protein
MPVWEYFRNAFARDAGLRIDHLLLSPSLKNRLVAGGVAREVRSWEKTSDHAPAWIELNDIAQSGSGRKRGIDGEETQDVSAAISSMPWTGTKPTPRDTRDLGARRKLAPSRHDDPGPAGRIIQEDPAPKSAIAAAAMIAPG